MSGQQPIDLQLLISILSLVFNILISILVGILTYLNLVDTAKPRIKVYFDGEAKTGRKSFKPGEKVSFLFTIKNVGRFYAKPAALNTTLYLNFDQAFELFIAHKGSNLEIYEKQVRRGKFNSKYFKVSRIHLFYNDIENVAVELQVPNTVGIYPIWISAFSNEASYGIFRFKINVVTS
jgi:hypothetical protein